MKTYEMAIKQAKDILRNAGVEEYETDAFLLMEDLLGMTRTQYLLRGKSEMPEADLVRYEEAVAKRADHIPLQYITGKAYFMGFEYMVNPNVLIPRMDTECLVVEVEKIIKSNNFSSVLDMCTGSGCIITSLALRNKINGLGVDISAGALGVAVENAKRLQCQNVEFLESDLFTLVEGKYQIIVSNPPYIKTEVIDGLMDEVKCYEPYGALDGHEDGLYFYEKITKEAIKYLTDDGFLCYEIGCDQGTDVVAIMENAGFKNCKVIKDLAGLDRIVIGNR